MRRFYAVALGVVVATTTSSVLCSVVSAQAGGQPFSVELPAIGHDIEVDARRHRLYVSVPTTHEVIVVSLTSQTIVDSIIVGQEPRGIDLSDDGSTLHVALGASGSVASLDLDSGIFTTLDVAAELGDPRTWDVVEGKPDHLYVSANPSSFGLAYIVQIETAQGNLATRVASNRIIRCGPVFEDGPDDEFLYVGECFSPNSLYKLDLSQETAPIVLEDNHGSVSGTDHLEVDPTGTRIYLRSGQVLRTGSFLQAGLVTPGAAQFGDDPTRVYVATEPGSIHIHDTATYLEVDDFPLPCSFTFIRELRVLPGTSGFLALGDDLLCGIVDTHAVAVEISPPSGRYISTQTVDLSLIIGTAHRGIAHLQLTVNGKDRTTAFLACAVEGETGTGQQTLRCPAWPLEHGTLDVDVTVELQGGTVLRDSVSWEVAAAVE